MKVDIKDYELMKDMAYDNREKFQMLHAKMLLIKEGESTLKEMYYDLVEKYQRKNQECEKLRNTLNEIEKKCSKYQTCIIVLKKDILDIINGAKDKNVLHKEKETK